MSEIQDMASGYSTSENTAHDTFIDTFGAIGSRADASATDLDDRNSIPALLKGIAHGLGLAAGTGAGTTDLSPNFISDDIGAMGSPGDDAATTMTGSLSAIAIAKGVLKSAGFA